MRKGKNCLPNPAAWQQRQVCLTSVQFLQHAHRPDADQGRPDRGASPTPTKHQPTPAGPCHGRGFSSCHVRCASTVGHSAAMIE